MPCCETCACIGEPFECLSVIDPVRYGFFGEWCRSFDDTTDEGRNRRLMVCHRSAIAAGAPPPRPCYQAAAGTLPQQLASAPPSLPLAGDLVDALASRIGAKVVAKLLEKYLGAPCGCEERRIKLNKLDALCRKLLGLRGGDA